MGGNGSKVGKSKRKTGGNQLRRSNRIALRVKEDAEGQGGDDTTEVEVIEVEAEDVRVRVSEKVACTSDTTEADKTNVVDTDQTQAGGVVEDTTEIEETVVEGTLAVDGSDLLEEDTGALETEDKEREDEDILKNEGVKTEEIQTTGGHNANIQDATIDEAKMNAPKKTNEKSDDDSTTNTPADKDAKHQVRSEQGCSTSTPANNNTAPGLIYSRKVDSEAEMEASFAETCSTLLGTAKMTSSTQSVVASSAASEAECNRIKKVFQSGLAIHFSGEEMEACKAVSTPLFPHQRVALAWMVKHENTCTDGMFGGILADDMGLGKSLTVISLVLTNFWDGMPLLKPELGFVRRPLTAGKRKGKGHRKRTRISAEAFGVGRKLGGGSGAVKKTTIGGLFDKFRNNNNQESGGGDLFKFGKNDRRRRYTRDEEDSDSFIDDDSSDSESSEDIGDGRLDVDDDSSDPEFDPKLNMDGFIDDDSDSEEDLPTTKKKVQKRKLYDSDSEDDPQPSKPTARISAKKLKVASSQLPIMSKLPIAPGDDSDQDSLPDVGDDETAPPYGDADLPSSSLQPQSRRNEETGLKLIIPPHQPAERRGRRRATLLVCPTSLIIHWVEQLQVHLDRSVDIKLRVHHGATKAQTVDELDKVDIVITTYGTMASEWGMQGISPLFKVKWLRVVMDEGHSIKNRNTKTAKAALDLNTLRRWIVTGTPIQNNLMDLWSLVNWLDFGLYAGKAGMGLYKEHIERPCNVGDPRGFERLQVLMDAICLRRTKTDKKPDGSLLVELPSKTILTREVVLGEEDRLCYALYHKYAVNVVTQYQKRGELMKNYAHVFVLMIRLRQLCCHRDMFREVDWEQVVRDKEMSKQLLESEAGTEKEVDQGLVKQLREMIRSGVSDDCSICLGDLVSPVITHCGHVFCRVCIEQVVDTVKPPTCPLCRNVVQKKELLEAGQDEEDEGVTDNTLADMADIIVDVSSSKINAVLKEMLRIRRDQPGDKIIVVSQFTSFLSILQPLLRENCFPTVRLDGSMTIMARSEVVSVFQSSHPNSPKVLLLSLKAGGVGLNLTAANHLLLLDPAWNPACEWQCFDRTHRMGQTKDVTIYKFITKDSIEERMLEIQAKKKLLITGAFNMPAEERRKARVAEIRSIFGI